MRWMRSVSGDIRFIWSYSFASFRHVQNFERTPWDNYIRWMNVILDLRMCFFYLSFVAAIWVAFVISLWWYIVWVTKTIHSLYCQLYSVEIFLELCTIIPTCANWFLSWPFSIFLTCSNEVSRRQFITKYTFCSQVHVNCIFVRLIGQNIFVWRAGM